MNFHAHSSALLRSRIQAIIEQRASSRSSSSSTNDLENLGNVIVSHPPTPTLSSYPGMNAESCAMSSRPFSTTEPFELSERIPLSDLDRKGTEKATEDDFGLILVTGGNGFIGSHTVLEILQQGKFGVVVIDNLANSNIEVLNRVRTLNAKLTPSTTLYPPLYFHDCDITSLTSLSQILSLYTLPNSTKSRIKSTIHFAALKSVESSLANPLSYYRTNVTGTLNLIEALSGIGAKNLVFSSSCVVYGSGCDGEGILESDCDVREGGGKGITNPYGRTKRMCEEILADLSASDEEWQTMSLRYTNPSGAHPSGWIGEDPTSAANLMPMVVQALQGKRKQVMIYGADYDTPDGTGVRDFIHVVDLAKAHLAAIQAMHDESLPSRNNTYNIGTNRGTSVLTVIETLSLIAQRSIRIVICPRRPGDLASVVCSAAKASLELGWKAELGFMEMCRDLVNWQALNPDGYKSIGME